MNEQAQPATNRRQAIEAAVKDKFEIGPMQRGLMVHIHEVYAALGWPSDRRLVMSVLLGLGCWKEGYGYWGGIWRKPQAMNEQGERLTYAEFQAREQMLLARFDELFELAESGRMFLWEVQKALGANTKETHDLLAIKAKEHRRKGGNESLISWGRIPMSDEECVAGLARRGALVTEEANGH